MIRFKAIIQIILAKKYLIVYDKDNKWWFHQMGMAIGEMEHAGNQITKIAKDELDSEMGVYVAKQILKIEP